MEQLTIRSLEHTDCGCCVLCGNRILLGNRPCLCLGDGDVVCKACGRERAPQLTALLELAQAADRVGKVCRHTLVPPMETLLDLARAAENYSNSASPKVLERAA